MRMDEAHAFAIARAKDWVLEICQGLRFFVQAIKDGALRGALSAELRADPPDPMPGLPAGLQLRQSAFIGTALLLGLNESFEGHSYGIIFSVEPTNTNDCPGSAFTYVYMRWPYSILSFQETLRFD